GARAHRRQHQQRAQHYRQRPPKRIYLSHTSHFLSKWYDMIRRCPNPRLVIPRRPAGPLAQDPWLMPVTATAPRLPRLRLQPPLGAPDGPAAPTSVLPPKPGGSGPLLAVPVHDAAPPPNAVQPRVELGAVVGHQQMNHLVQERLVHLVRVFQVIVGGQPNQIALRVTASRRTGQAPAPLDDDLIPGRQAMVEVQPVVA